MWMIGFLIDRLFLEVLNALIGHGISRLKIPVADLIASTSYITGFTSLNILRTLEIYQCTSKRLK